MFTDTRDNLDDYFQEYMHNMIKGKDIPNEWASNEKEEGDNKGVSQFVKQVNEGYNDLNHTDDIEQEDLR